MESGEKVASPDSEVRKEVSPGFWSSSMRRGSVRYNRPRRLGCLEGHGKYGLYVGHEGRVVRMN